MPQAVDEFDSGLARMYPRLRRLAHALCGHAADAEDLAQQAAERALRARNQWQPGTSFDGWIYRILRNAWIDLARSRTRQGRVFAPPEHGETVGHDARPDVEARLRLAKVMAAMQALPDEQREAVALVLIEGLGYREAAEVLDIPVGTLTSRLARGRTALLTLSGEEGASHE